jgi:Protein of unknown function (DUF551)
MSEWQDIESAPKDGSYMLMYFPEVGYRSESIRVGFFDADKYAKKPKPYFRGIGNPLGVKYERDNQPTHWMPLPKPPEAKP